MSELCLRRNWRSGGRCGSWLGLRLLLLFRRSDNCVQDRAFHARHKLNGAGIANVLDKAVDLGISQFAVGHLAAAKTQAGFYLVAFGKEAKSMILLGLVVVLVESDRELHFLDDDHFLLLTRSVFALIFFVEEAAVILDAADRRNGIGRDLHQIESPLAGDLQRLKRR